ncbi:MAG: type III-A CRISPR-associated protein Cas10/Csm1, partial [Desulfovermiculus sp.]
ELEGYRSRIAALAAGHHNPDLSDLISACIAKGDRLASGWDRQGTEEEAGGDRQAFKKARLNAIQDEVQLLNHEFQDPGQWFVPLKPLSMNKGNLFPVQESRGEAKDYAPLYEQFLERLRQVPTDQGFAHYLACLIRVLEDFTWCIPSATYKALPDISLFDHSLCSAAVAQALTQYHQDVGGKPESGPDESKFLLIGGDLSGIQSFIFNVSESKAKGAGKLYRARSFYLQALTKSVVLILLSRLGLHAPAQLMDAGGKFMLLAANTQATRQTIQDMQKELDSWMVESFKGQLSMTLASLPVRPKDLDLKEFHNILDSFNFILEEAKCARLASWLQEHEPALHSGYEEIAASGPCEICEIHPALSVLKDGTPSCLQCRDHIETIGTRLPRTTGLEYNYERGAELFGGIKVFLLGPKDKPNPSKSVLIQQTDNQMDTAWPRAWIAGYIPEITSQDLAHTPFFKALEEENPDLDFKAMSEDEYQDLPKTFHLIAQKARQENETRDTSTGRALLGVLKADVDNLGLVFTLGLRGRVSLSRFASLSRMFSAFFSGYLVRMIQESDKYKDTYVVFSGGDDLFLLGPWKQTLELAGHIRSEFAAFCGHNPDMSLSCGLTLTKPKFPLRRSAPLAEQALDQAKDRTKGDIPVKDAVSIFGQVLSWEEFAQQMDKAAWLEDRARDEQSGVKTAFLYRMLTYARQAEAMLKEKKPGETVSPRNGLYLSHAHYDIARNIMRTEKGVLQNPEEVAGLVNMVNAAQGAQAFVKNSVALQWAMSNLRK